jgi:hypothetical protein
MLGIVHDELFPTYMEAVKWCTDMLGEEGLGANELDDDDLSGKTASAKA